MSLSRLQMAHLVKCEVCAHVYTGAASVTEVSGAISVISGNQVSLLVYYCKQSRVKG